MLERQVAELLATYLSRFIEDVNAEQLEISLWSGNVVLNNVHLRADVLERITALLHGEAEGMGGDDTSGSPRDSPSGSSAPADAAAAKSAASVRMLLAPFTVVKGIVRHLTIQVPWSSLESEPIHVQISGVELVLGPLRARPFNAWEEQEREEAIKQQQLARYEEERQRLSRGAAGELDSRSSSVASGSGNGGATAAAASKAKAASSGPSADASGGSWFSWIWDFDRIGQTALRNVCLTLRDVSLRYEFDYDGLHPTLAKALCVFVREMRVTTTTQSFHETFATDLLAPWCKKIAVSDVVVSTHAMRLSTSPTSQSRQGSVPRAASAGAVGDGDAAAATDQTEASVTSAPECPSSSVPPSAYETYKSHWAFSSAVLSVAQLELLVKVVPPNVKSLNPIVESAEPLPATATELTVSVVDGVKVTACFGVFQALESMWRSYHQSLGCARYRKRLHLLRRARRVTPAFETAGVDSTVAEASMELSSSPMLPGPDGPPSRQLARQRWRFALRCVLDDVQQQRQTFQRHERSRREVVEGMVQFCQLRRTYCQYWKRTQGVSWAPPLDALEEKKLALMERQLSLTQVLFLRCLAYGEMLQEQEGHARQQAFIEEARLRKQRAEQDKRRGKASPQGRSGGLWGWFTQSASNEFAAESTRGEAAEHALSAADRSAHSSGTVFGVPASLEAVPLSRRVADEWALGQRFASPHRAPLVQPSVPQSILPEATGSDPFYLTLRCLVESVTVVFDPVYWPLLNDSSVPPPPQHTPLRHIRQQLHLHLRAIETFFTSVPDDRPDKAAWSLFVSAARVTFEGTPRSVLLQSKEAEGEDFIVVKQNAARTHAAVWVAPLLMVCQPLHEWRWWGEEASAFVAWFTALQRAFYTSSQPPTPAASSAVAAQALEDTSTAAGAFSRGARSPSFCSAPPSSGLLRYAAQTPVRGASYTLSDEAPPLTWSVILQSADICVPLFARDIDDWDLDIVDHAPSGLSSLVMMDSVATALPQRGTSADQEARRFSSVEAGGDKDGGTAPSPSGSLAGARGTVDLHSFLFTGGEFAEEKRRSADGTESLESSVSGSFVSAKPERCFLNDEACLVLSISTTRLCTVPPAKQRSAGEGNEYYLCVGDHDKAVRLFCQLGAARSALSLHRHLELMSFVAGEVLVGPREVSILFNQGINVIVEPDAFAVLSDTLLKPAVFTALDEEAQRVQLLVQDLIAAEAAALGTQPAWRLVDAGQIVMERDDGQGGQSAEGVAARHFQPDCLRHIMAAVLAARPASTANLSVPSEHQATEAAGALTIALGVSVVQLLIRSVENEDLAEMLLVAPVEVPAVTAPYRSALSALGAEEPRALELLWRPSASPVAAATGAAASELPLPYAHPRRDVGEGEEKEDRSGQASGPLLVLSVPDATLTTATGRKLLTVEQLTVVHNTPATPGSVADVTISMDAVEACFDVAVVDLTEVAIGTLGALRPMRREMFAPDAQAAETGAGMAEEEAALAGLPKLDLLVRSLHVQLPLTLSDAEGTPYVEVNAELAGLRVTVNSSSAQDGQRTWDIHVGFQIDDAVQLIDYVGGDPEVRKLVTPHRWPTQTDVTAMEPLRCDVDIRLGAAQSDAGDAAAAAPSVSAIHVSVHGGAVHVYFPFLYVYVAVLARDQRLRRLARLRQSSLLVRGFTFLAREQLARERRGGVSTASSSPTRRGTEPKAGRRQPQPVEVTAVLTQVDVFLATDAAVPIDLESPDSLCVVRLAEVRAGVSQTLSDAADATTAPRYLRTRAYLDTVSLYLLDLTRAGTKHAQLPNVKVRTEAGVLLVPKTTLTGFTYQRGTRGDTTVLVGVHAALAEGAKESADGAAAASASDVQPKDAESPASSPKASASPVISVDLTAYQCQTLIRVVARNVLQPRVAEVQHGSAVGTMEEAAHSVNSPRRRTAYLQRRSLAGSADDFAEFSDSRPPAAASALTLLVTVPALAFVLRIGSSVRYTLALRRGAQFYSASGGAWSQSPVKNGQLSGLELSARDGEVGDEARERGAAVILFAADLIGVALVEGRPAVSSTTPPAATGTAAGEGGGSRAAEEDADAAPVVRVVAAVRNTTVQVPHVRWWLRLYALCTDPDVAKAETCSVSPGSRAASAPQPSTCTPLSLHESSVSANALGPLPHRRGEGSSQQSSVVLGSRGQSGQRNHAGPGWGRGGRGAHTPSAASSSSRWLCGSLEITNTQFSFGGGETDTGAGITSAQLPWCRVIVPEARIAAAPVRVLNDSGEARLYDEFTFVLPQCPQVLLRASGTAGGATAKGLYVSVLKLHAASTASSLRPTPTPVSAPAGPCVRVQLIWSPDSKLISSLHYGRSYHMTDLALHRTCAVQLQLSGLMLHFPASELFMFAHELLHQSREVHRIFALADTRPSPASRRTRGPARTYAGLEAQLSHVGVVISAESPRTDATAAATPGGSEDSPWCGVTVTSITVATDVELQSVLTNAGEPATLMDDAGAAGWRMCVWHLNSSVAFRGVVLAGHHGATVRWTAPQVDVAASQPLPRTVVCVRPSRDAATDDDSGVLDSEPSSLMLRQRNSTDFFHVEPTAAHVCSELNSHLLTTVRVAVGEPESAEAEVHTAGPPPRCIEMPVSTAYVLGRSALYLVELWQETEKAHAAPVESTPAVEDDGSRTDTHNATRKPLLSRGPVMWYEVRLSLRGHTLRVLSELPPSAAHAAALHCLAEVTITNDIVYQLNRELHGDAFDNPLAEPDSDAEQSASEEDGAAHVSVSEQHRLCVGAVRVWDGKGTLLFLLSGEVTEGEGEAHWAAVADYVQAEQCLRVVADHVLLAASPVTVAFAVEWLRAAQAWLRLWTGAAPAVTTPEGTEPVSVSVFVSLDMEVRQVEVLLPPAGFVIIQRPRLQHTRRQASTPVADAAATAIGDTWELSCAEVALHSTPAVMRSVGHRDRKPELLASVVSPLLRHCSDAGSGATVLCRVPSVTLVNRVRHSWRLCVLRAAACVSAALTLWRATEEAETTPRTRRSPPARLPAVQAVVDRAEVLCHAPTESGVGANPALVVRAEQLQLMLPSDNRPCTASALLSAFGDAGGVAATEQLLERTAVTLRVRGIADLSTTSASRAREVHFAVGGDGVRCHVPSAETLRHVAGALWMVVDQQWQRTASGTSVPSVLGGSFHNVSASPGAKQPPAWTVTLHVARFRCDCYAPIQRQRLAELIVQELHGSYRASRNAERSNFLLHVASIECETDVAEAAAVVEATPAAVTGGAASGSAARLLSVMPRSDLSSPSDNGPLDPWRVGPADAHRFALYAQQQCLPLSHSDGADDAAEHSCADTATALTVRLHLLQMRVPLALAQALCEAVLAPLVRGVRCAAATSSRQALTEAAHSTVLQVRQPRAVMPALDELERHAALVRVVEVHSDWTLREDLHLGGGGGGECALQLRFSNASARHVITVRGDAAEGAAPVTIYLSCCERIDGSLGPAIRVDAEVTVRFAQVRVVVEDRHGHGAATPDAFVELGERALCSFPPPPAAPIASPAVGAPAAAAAPETPSAVEKSDSAGGSGGASRTAWAATSVYSMDLKLGFDAALTAHRRCLAAAGSLQMRYRFEDKRRGGETMRLERDGEATVTLRSCTDEVGDLTRTPLRVVAGLGYGEEHDGRVRMTVNMGTALWRLSMWHVQMLAALGKSLRDCFVRAAPVQPSPAKTAAASAELWTSPAPLPGRPTKLSTIVVATPLDVAVEVPHWALSLTDDLQTPLAVCNVSSARLQCTADTNLSDMVVKAAAVLSVTDRCPRLCPKPLVGDGDGEEDKGLQESMLASSATTRVLLSAKPAVTVVWTRFSADSSSLSISADVEDVVATLPVSTALRALRRAQTGLDSGTRAFWNETGVELLVSPQGTEPSTAAAPCRLSALPAPRVEVTGIPSAAPLLTLTAQPSCGAEGSAGATLDLRDLHADVATRLRLPGYHSPFGALDVLARKAVHGGVAVVRLTTTVELSNAFFAPESDADGKGATVLLRGSAEEAGAVAVPPRGSRCIPLPLLRDCLSFEMGSCVYAAPAKLLTWAMVADAMTVLADQVASGASAGGGALASVVEPLRKLGVQAEREDSADGRSGLPPVCGHARLLNATTIAFPVLLQPLPRSVSESLNPTVHSAAEAERAAEGAVAPTSPIRAAAGELSTPPPRVVQLTWRRRRSMQPQLLFSGQLPPCEYTVKVEPVWTLWNCTGCLLRLRVCLPRGRGSSSVTGNTATPHATAQESSAAEAVLPPPTPTATHRVLTSAVVESGTCFQWLPGSLEELQGDVTVFFQVAAPACSPLQWWSAAATLSLREAPPAFIRLQQGSSCPRGALATEQHGSSTVVLRCAALLHSRMPRPVYLRAADKPGPLPGTDAQGCVQPQQTVPLFFSEYAATLAPNAQRVGFVVRETPLHAGSPDEQEETDPYVLSTPVAATVLSADERDDCTLFYAVSALKRDGEEESSAEEAPPEHERALWQPRPPPALQLRPLCVVHNADATRTLFVRPFLRPGAAPTATMSVLTTETAIPPGESREVLRFCPRAEEPEVHLCYSDDAGHPHAHVWLPPVRLLSLATSTVPLVLKHPSNPAAVAAGPAAGAGEFTVFPAPRRAQQQAFATSECCRCLELQSSTAEGRLTVQVRLLATPPLRVVNRLNATLQFAQLVERGATVAGGGSPAPPAVKLGADSVQTALCSAAPPPWSYLVAPESSSYGCWEVPTLEFHGLRVTLHSNTHRGRTVSVDLDLLQCAASPSSGTRVGETDAYVYVSLDHATHQYTVTVIPTRQLEKRMLFQPRRLTQVEVLVPRCTVYVAAVTLPSSGVFSRLSVIARGARGRLRRWGAGKGVDDVVVPVTASDEDVLTLLRQAELDVLCVRVVGVYGSVTMTERNLFGSASLGILEVVDCTMPEAEYPIVLRMAPGPQTNGSASRGGTPSDASAPAASTAADVAAASMEVRDGASLAAGAAGVPRFKDPSWCNVEVQLTRSAVRTAGVVMLPIQQLRISVPPIVVQCHDEFLCTVRAAAERVREEWAATTQPPLPPQAVSAELLPAASTGDESASGSCPADVHAAPASPRLRGPRTTYNVFFYELSVSAVVVKLTYTRASDRRYSPFRDLGALPVHLIPSMEGLRVSLKPVRLLNVELRSATSFAAVVTSFVWPLYRAQLLLQSYKVVGALDFLGNPHALLSSWSRGMWELVTNKSGQSRWAGTSAFLRTTTSSTLHSVGMLARSIGSLTGSSTPAAGVSAGGGGGGSSGGDAAWAVTGQRRGVLREVLAEMGGGMADAVWYPLQGAREGGVNGFFMGMASGMAGLVGRPVFGFFRGVGVTSEFYARLLRGQPALTEMEARRLAVARNYHLSPAEPSDAAVASDGYGPTLPGVGHLVLSSAAFEQAMADVARWRRGEEKNVRTAIARVGVQNAALYVGYASTTAFFTHEEFAASLPTALTTLLAARLAAALTQRDARQPSKGGRDARGAEAADGGQGESRLSGSRLAQECHRAAHIKASLGVDALHKYVVADVFVRVCTLHEIADSVSAAELHAKYVILLAKVINSAGDALFTA